MHLMPNHEVAISKKARIERQGNIYMQVIIMNTSEFRHIFPDQYHIL